MCAASPARNRRPKRIGTLTDEAQRRDQTSRKTDPTVTTSAIVSRHAATRSSSQKRASLQALVRSLKSEHCT